MGLRADSQAKPSFHHQWSALQPRSSFSSPLPTLSALSSGPSYPLSLPNPSHWAKRECSVIAARNDIQLSVVPLFPSFFLCTCPRSSLRRAFTFESRTLPPKIPAVSLCPTSSPRHGISLTFATDSDVLAFAPVSSLSHCRRSPHPLTMPLVSLANHAAAHRAGTNGICFGGPYQISTTAVPGFARQIAALLLADHQTSTTGASFVHAGARGTRHPLLFGFSSRQGNPS